MVTGSPREYAPDLQLTPEGWWVSAKILAPSYPADGNALCHLVEESSFWFQHRRDCILAAIQHFPPEGTLFDVGAGNGHLALAMQESGFNVVAVEPGLAGARNALQRGVRTVVQATLEDVGILAGSVPAIGLFDVLEHVHDDCGFLTYASRLMVPGGRVYLTVPAYRWLWSNEDIVAGHFRRYSLAELRDVLERAGFAIDFATYIFSFLPVPILLRRALPYRLGRGSGRLSESALRSDHEVGNPLTRRILQVLMRRELSRIGEKRPLGLGGSCLIVGKKNQGS